VTLDRAEAAKNHHRRTEIALHQAVRHVYAHPEEALRKILADPKAFDRLAVGEAAAYGELRGQGRLFGKDAARVSAEREIPGLRSAIWTHREAEASLGRQQNAAARVQGGPTEIKVQLDRVTTALRQVAAYARQPERALEIAVRQTSRAAVQAPSRYSLPPPASGALRPAGRRAGPWSRPRSRPLEKRMSLRCPNNFPLQWFPTPRTSFPKRWRSVSLTSELERPPFVRRARPGKLRSMPRRFFQPGPNSDAPRGARNSTPWKGSLPPSVMAGGADARRKDPHKVAP